MILRYMAIRKPCFTHETWPPAPTWPSQHADAWFRCAGPLKDPDFASHANCDAEWELNDCTFSNEPSAGPIEPIYAQRYVDWQCWAVHHGMSRQPPYITKQTAMCVPLSGYLPQIPRLTVTHCICLLPCRQDATPVLLSKFMPLGLEHLESFQEGWGKFRDEDPEQPHPSWHAVRAQIRPQNASALCCVPGCSCGQL